MTTTTTAAEEPSLFCHPKIHWTLRVGVPIVLVVTIGLLIFSNTSDGASVKLELTLQDGIVTYSDEMFMFTLQNSVQDMWDAKIYPLSILIALCSGGWPYLKCLLMLATWVLPPKILPVQRRERVMVWLDFLGKWSLVDTFVMVLMMVVFHFDLDFGVAQVVVVVNPGVGLMTFLLATLVLLTMGHVTLAFHRYTATPTIEDSAWPVTRIAAMDYTWHVKFISCSSQHSDQTAEGGLGLDDTRTTDNLRPLLEADYERSARNSQPWNRNSQPWNNNNNSLSLPPLEEREVRLTLLSRAVIAVLLFSSIVLIAVGAAIPSFEFDFEGMVAVVMPYDTFDSSNPRPFSMITAGSAMPRATDYPDRYDTRWLQTCYFVFTLVMPLAFLCIMLFLWVTPLNLRRFSAVFKLAEVCQAWSSIEVFVLSIIFAILEIATFADFIIGDKCDLINKFIKEYLDPIVPGPDKCFAVTTKLVEGTPVLFSASLVVIVMAYFVLNKVLHSIHQNRLLEVITAARAQVSLDRRFPEKYTGNPAALLCSRKFAKQMEKLKRWGLIDMQEVSMMRIDEGLDK